MASTGGKESAIAKVYATAIHEVAKSTGQVDLVAKELRGLADFIAKDAAFQLFLDSPTVDMESRKLTLEKLFRGKYSDVLVDSLQVLNRNERLGLIGQVAKAFHLLHEEAMGRVELHVRTAAPLSDPMRVRLRERIATATGKQVDLLERIDSSLIGGIVLQLGDRKFDGSVRRKLTTMANILLERSSRELHNGKAYVVGAAG